MHGSEIHRSEYCIGRAVGANYAGRQRVAVVMLGVSDVVSSGVK